MKTRTTKAVLAVSAALLTAGTWSTSAQAAPGVSYIGYGQGNTYNGVLCVQKLTNDLTAQIGYHRIAEDGSFGPDTNGAIKAFQRWEHLPVDGIVGPATGDALLSQAYNVKGCYPYVPSHH